MTSEKGAVPNISFLDKVAIDEKVARIRDLNGR
jgi:hypothetical protein